MATRGGGSQGLHPVVHHTCAPVGRSPQEEMIRPDAQSACPLPSAAGKLAGGVGWGGCLSGTDWKASFPTGEENIETCSLVLCSWSSGVRKGDSSGWGPCSPSCIHGTVATLWEEQVLLHRVGGSSHDP